MARKKKDISDQASTTVVPDGPVTGDTLILSEDPIREGIEAVQEGRVQKLDLDKLEKPAVRTKTKRVKRMNFDVYARRKGIKATRVAGMKAFTGNPRIPRTMEDWDLFFEKY